MRRVNYGKRAVDMGMIIQASDKSAETLIVRRNEDLLSGRSKGLHTKAHEQSLASALLIPSILSSCWFSLFCRHRSHIRSPC